MIKDGRFKGFGYVCFSILEEVIEVVIEMNGRIIVIKFLYVSFV